MWLEQLIEIAARDSGENPGLPPEWKREVQDRGEVEHAAFTTRLDEAKGEWTCTCSSCARIGDLGLKFVLHHGEYVVQRIAGREKLLGPRPMRS